MTIKISKTKRAVAIDHFGGPDVLTLHSLPVPVPEPHEVLIRLHTAGVGGWDAADARRLVARGQAAVSRAVLGSDGAGHRCRSGVARAPPAGWGDGLCLQL